MQAGGVSDGFSGLAEIESSELIDSRIKCRLNSQDGILR